ncbi:EF-P beta-lysylation protein EpmB [Glaciecola sp. MF2-115]|uniref:EF-P beta-lysylation protein EpmB n=1 Tax=Glaciecola sp. MF2-115 TaxID=3384827 RepID=UPI0039A2D02B
MNRIIPKNTFAVESNWQKELANSFTTLESLLEFLELDPSLADKNSQARKLFAMRVPRHFANLMKKKDIQDPLLMQVLPQFIEYKDTPGFVKDPLHEQGNKIKGLLHKYENRVLLIVKTGCAINCRYCFRREFPYEENAVNKRELENALAYIRNNSAINEVILSGGDPLMSKDNHLKWLVAQLEEIPHLVRLRIHTRLPVVIPSRVNDEFIDWFSKCRFQKILVLHTNHANEVSPELEKVCLRMKNNGITLLNQAVLLKGINDDVAEQQALSEALFGIGVMPYYLHLLDKVKGAAHFEVDLALAKELMRNLIKRLPGFLVPKLVTEIGGQPSKTPIDLNLQPSSEESLGICVDNRT